MRRRNRLFEPPSTSTTRIAKDHPEMDSFQSGLAITQVHLGFLYATTGRRAEAERSYRAALEIRQQLVKKRPGSSEHVIDLAEVQSHLGRLALASDRPQDALTWFEQARRQLQPMHEKGPDKHRSEELLTESWVGSAMALAAMSRPAESAKAWDQAFKLDKGKNRLVIRLRRAEALAHAGDFTRALAEAEDLAQVKGLPRGEYYNLACFWSLAVTAARRDTKLSADMRDKEAERRATRALDLLRKAEAAGYFKDPAIVDHLDKDKDLERSARARITSPGENAWSRKESPKWPCVILLH